MPGDSISIPIPELQRAGTEFRTASEETRRVLQRLQQAVNHLEPQWEGLAKDRFIGEYRQWEATLRQLVQLLENVGAQLEGVASIFSEGDRDMGRRVDRIERSGR